tara:strand:+ start:1102 stop:1353 length:252 start_codon:yes stop_codon:yes gene_type:complete
MESYLQITLIFLLLFNVVINFIIIKRDDFEVTQKIGQIIAVWLFPIIGATGIWLFYKSIDKPITKPASFAKRSEGSNSWQDTP